MISIRQEQKQDEQAVYKLVKEAFATAEHSDGDEQDLVVRLRSSEAFIPALSLIAESDGELAGHILLTKFDLGEIRAVTVAPLAVLPRFQRQGVGTLLLGEGHRIARELGYEFSVLVGHEWYYPRFGYRPASEFGIISPIEVPAVNFMALNLQGTDTKPNRMGYYAKEFF